MGFVSNEEVTNIKMQFCDVDKNYWCHCQIVHSNYPNILKGSYVKTTIYMAITPNHVSC